jgi:hypothetical protein
MPKAGRLALIKSVLAAIPLQQLMVLSMDKKSIKKIERIFLCFLWAGNVNQWRELPCQLVQGL